MLEESCQEGEAVKAEVLKLLPKAVCRKRQFGSLIGWVVFRDSSLPMPGIGSGATASQAWASAWRYLEKGWIIQNVIQRPAS